MGEKLKKKVGKKKILFFAGITSRHPNDPTHHKTSLKSISLQPGSLAFVRGDTTWGNLGFAATKWGGKTWHSGAGICFIKKPYWW